MCFIRLRKSVCIAALPAVFVFGAAIPSAMIGFVSSVQANTVFFDNFNDGSATDGSPVTWVPLAGFDTGTFSAATGDYVVTQPSDGWPQVASPSIAPLTATSIRAQVRELQGRGFISLFGRLNTVGTPSGYQAGIGLGALYIVRTDAPFNNTDLASASTDLDPSIEDVFLQFDIIGSQLSLYAWSPGDDKPLSPSLSAIDNTFATGLPGILIDSGTSHSVAFRAIHVADMSIPEPSGLALAGLAVLAVVFQASRKRRRSDS